MEHRSNNGAITAACRHAQIEQDVIRVIGQRVARNGYLFQGLREMATRRSIRTANNEGVGLNAERHLDDVTMSMFQSAIIDISNLCQALSRRPPGESSEDVQRILARWNEPDTLGSRRAVFKQKIVEIAGKLIALRGLSTMHDRSVQQLQSDAAELHPLAPKPIRAIELAVDESEFLYTLRLRVAGWQALALGLEEDRACELSVDGMIQWSAEQRDKAIDMYTESVRRAVLAREQTIHDSQHWTVDFPSRQLQCWPAESRRRSCEDDCCCTSGADEPDKRLIMHLESADVEVVLRSHELSQAACSSVRAHLLRQSVQDGPSQELLDAIDVLGGWAMLLNQWVTHMAREYEWPRSHHGRWELSPDCREVYLCVSTQDTGS